MYSFFDQDCLADLVLILNVGFEGHVHNLYGVGRITDASSIGDVMHYRDTSLIRNCAPLGPYSRTVVGLCSGPHGIIGDVAIIVRTGSWMGPP